MKKNIRASTVALITCQVNLRDIMDGLLRSKVTRADEFKWLMQFKFNMKKMEEAVYKSAYDPSALNKLETNKIEVDEYLNNINLCQGINRNEKGHLHFAELNYSSSLTIYSNVVVS